jgi:hypothetical protein
MRRWSLPERIRRDSGDTVDGRRKQEEEEEEEEVEEEKKKQEGIAGINTDKRKWKVERQATETQSARERRKNRQYPQ